MRIFFNRVPRQEPYGGGNQFLAAMVDTLKMRGHEVVFHLVKDVDVIFLMDPRPGDIGYSIEHVVNYKQAFPRTKIVHRINECDQRKGTNFMDSLLIRSSEVADEVIFISKWLQEYFKDKGITKNSHVIYNGCDTKIFKPENKSQLKKPVSIVTHHWSDNWMKGFDIYTQIDKYLGDHPEAGFSFTYVGRYWNGYKPISTRLVSPLHGKLLANELVKHDIYVTASRWEPCGMHHVEGVACGMPVLYHKEGGGINELCKKHGEGFSSFEEFLEKLNLIVKNYDLYRDKIDYELISIDRVCEEYAKIVESI